MKGKSHGQSAELALQPDPPRRPTATAAGRLSLALDFMPEKAKYMAWTLLAASLMAFMISGAALSYFLKDWLAEQSEWVNWAVIVIFCLPGIWFAALSIQEQKKLNAKL